MKSAAAHPSRSIRTDGRLPDGTYWPSVRAKLKVWHRCGTCGRDLYKSETWLDESTKDLVHLDLVSRTLLCGPVYFQKNPAYLTDAMTNLRRGQSRMQRGKDRIRRLIGDRTV